MDLDPSSLALLAFALFGTGLVAGTLAGLLGVGGGIVIVPVLYHVLGVAGIDPALRMHLAVGTSLATIIVTASQSVRSHLRRDAVDRDLLRRWALPVLLGVGIGSGLAQLASGPLLARVFGTVALIVSLHMAFGRESWRLAERLPRGAASHGLGSGIGVLSVMMGLGGGTLGVPVLTLFGVPIHRAVGSAAGLGLLIAIPGALAFTWNGLGVPGRPPGSVGYVNLVGFALIVPATALAAPLGARLAHSIDARGLRRAFALFLAITALRMLLGG